MNWIREHGGEVLFRQKVTKVEVKGGKVTAVLTNKGLHQPADIVLANMTPWALSELMGEHLPSNLKRKMPKLKPTWGAFTLYLGVDRAKLPHDLVGHHQVIVDHTQPMGEGNSIFMSFSDPDDIERAPTGKLAVTISTHTDIAPWWKLRNDIDRAPYLDRRNRDMQKMLDATETGQSTAGVTLGGMRVATAVLAAQKWVEKKGNSIRIHSH